MLLATISQLCMTQLLLLLLILNDVFAMAEIAIVLAKKAQMMERFLSTVQIGITPVWGDRRALSAERASRDM